MANSLQSEWDAAAPSKPTTDLQAAWDAAAPKAKAEAPSNLAVTSNALYKGLASVPDGLLQLGSLIGRHLLPPNVRDATPATPNVAQEGLSKLGLIRPENEPQTPGQRVLDRAVSTGSAFLLSPASGVRQAVTNAVTGGLSGTAAGVTKEATGSEPLATAVGMATPLAVQSVGNAGRQKVAEARAAQQANAVRDETLREGQQAGYVIPPSSVNPSFVNNRLESIAGKAAVKQDASIRNQDVTNALARQSVGLPPNTPITEGRLDARRNTLSQPYRDVAAISPQSADALQQLRDARFEANGFFRHYERTADPNSLRQARQFSQQADALEQQLEQSATQSGRPELVDALRQARQDIAKTYDVERGLNVGDANVSAPVLGRALDHGKPLTGELRTVGRMAEAFPQVMREESRVPVPGVSGTDAAASAILGTLGYGASGPAGLAAAGLPLVRGPARSLVLSPTYQRFFAQPNYGQGRYLSMIPEVSPEVQALQAAIAARQGKE